MDKIQWEPASYGVERAVGIRSACCGARVHSKTNDDDMGAHCSKCLGHILDIAAELEKKYSPVEEAAIRDHALKLFESVDQVLAWYDSPDFHPDALDDALCLLREARAKCKPGPEPTFNTMDMDSDLSMTATNVISRCCDAPVRGSYGSEMYRCAECGLSPCETYEVAK